MTVLRDFHPTLRRGSVLPSASARSRQPLNITIEVVWTCEFCTSPLVEGDMHDCGHAPQEGGAIGGYQLRP